MKKLLKSLMVVAVAFAITGCNDSGGNTSNKPVTMAGSTSMEKMMTAMNESYYNETGNEATAQYTGSGAGIEAVLSGSVNIGNASRALKEEEKQKGAVENIVAIDGIAVVIDKANNVTNLTKDQLAKIYKGEIKNWSEVGGADQNIVVIGREAGSGTRGAFEEILKIENQCQYAQEIDSTGTVMAKVASIPGSIGYVSLDVVNDTVKALQIEGVEGNEENIKAGTYALQRPFVMVTKGEISTQDQAVQDYFKFIESDKGQEIIKSVGLITVN